MVKIKICGKYSTVHTLTQNQSAKLSRPANITVIYLMTTYTEVGCRHSGIVLLLFTHYREIAESLSVEYWQYTFKEVCCNVCLLSITGKHSPCFRSKPVDGKLPLTVPHVNPKCPDRKTSTLVPQK